MSGNTTVTAVPLAIGGDGSQIAFFSHGAGTAHGAPLTHTVRSAVRRTHGGGRITGEAPGWQRPIQSRTRAAGGYETTFGPVGRSGVPPKSGAGLAVWAWLVDGRGASGARHGAPENTL